MIDSLAQVVQQRPGLGNLGIRPQFVGQDVRQVGGFDRVSQLVLAVAGAELQAAQQLDDLRVQSRHAGVDSRLLTCLADDLVYLIAGCRHHLLDAGRMDTPIEDQPVQGNPGHLTAYRVKAGE